jgi:hypothetical protein
MCPTKATSHGLPAQKVRKHPLQEAYDAEERLLAKVASLFDEFIILRYRAWNEPPYNFEWVNEDRIIMDYGAALIRILRKYDTRF